jgi:hypothetical protein
MPRSSIELYRIAEALVLPWSTAQGCGIAAIEIGAGVERRLAWLIPLSAQHC